jgi:uroporphyrinogen III methyltransferase/synthase
MEALGRAEVVVYDRLAHPRLLDLAPQSSERIFAGKMADRHTLTQDEINAVIAERAASGKTVVRLKGGDPFVFGRGAEEAEYLRERGIAFVVVPGISSAIAAPAYAGIPVTHRDASSSFAVITGHERAGTQESGAREPGSAEQRRRWDKIAHAADTLIFLMGVESISEIADRLMENGRPSDTPVAMVRWGTWAGKQQTLTGELENIAARVHESGFAAPAVTVVGEVVRLRERLRWWDDGPLYGKKVVVTRAREQASTLVAALEQLGADVFEFPTVRIQPPTAGYAELDAALADIPGFSWVVLTSANSVDALFARLFAAGKDARALTGPRIAAVGPATAERLKQHGIAADFVPANFTGEDAAGSLPDIHAGARVLVPCAAQASEALPAILRERGAVVIAPAAYETIHDAGDVAAIRSAIDSHNVDAITFTSSSTVKNFARAFGADLAPLAGVTVACIGPSTASTARELFGREPDIVAEEHTISGLVAALSKYYAASTD